MEKRRHTPGPWTYTFGAVYAQLPEDQDANTAPFRLLCADRDNADTWPTERDANCQLAATAPQLLALCEEIHKASHVAVTTGRVNLSDSFFKRLADAIRRATE